MQHNAIRLTQVWEPRGELRLIPPDGSSGQMRDTADSILQLSTSCN